MLINTRFKRLSFPYDHTVNSESTFRSDWPGTLLKVSIRANRPRRIWIPGHRRRRQAGCFVVFSRHVGTGYQVHDTCSQTWKFFRGAPASSLSSLLISNQAWPAVSTEWSRRYFQRLNRCSKGVATCILFWHALFWVLEILIPSETNRNWN